MFHVFAIVEFYERGRGQMEQGRGRGQLSCSEAETEAKARFSGLEAEALTRT